MLELVSPRRVLVLALLASALLIARAAAGLAGPASGAVIDSAPPPQTTAPAAAFAFHATDAACSLDGADFMPCSSPITFYDLTSGPHRFQVRSGGGIPAAAEWTVEPADVPADPYCAADGCFDIDHTMSVAHDLAVTIGARYPNTSGDLAAQQYLSDAFTSYGLYPQVQRFPLPQGGSSANVVGSPAPDSGAVMSGGRFVLVDAHFDTSKGVTGGNDNASGTASMIDFARALQAQPASVPVIFVGYGAEENQPNGSNRVGSRYFLAHMTATQRANLVAMVNLDMIGHGSKVLLRWISGTPQEATNRLVSIGQTYGITTSVVNLATSDETYFAKAGLNVGSLRGETPACYDRPCDTFSTIEPAEVQRAARLGLAEVRSYDANQFWARIGDGWTGVKYSGTWSRTSLTCASGGGYESSATKGNTSTFTFYGTGARWISMLASNEGKAQVSVDGVVQGTYYDLYSATRVCNVQEFEVTGLAPGSHQLQVKVLGTKNTSSAGTRVVVDAYEYLH